MMCRILIALAAALVANVSAAATLPVTPATAAAQIAAAAQGDTVLFAPGVYAPIFIKAKGLILDARQPASQPQAQFDSIRLQGVKTTAILGGLFKPTSWLCGIYVSSGSSGVTVDGAVVDGGGAQCGMVFRDSDHITLKNLKISRVTGGVQLLNLDTVVLDHSQITDFLGDGTTAASVRHLRYTSNVCVTFVNDGVHHGDCFQGWSVAGLAQAADYLLDGNFCAGVVQCWDDFGGDGRGIDGFVITHNRGFSAEPQVLAVYESPGAVIQNNLVATLPVTKYKGSLNVQAAGVLRCGNVVEPALGKPGLTEGAC